MKTFKSASAIVVSLALLAGCIAPRLGTESVRYDNVQRLAVSEDTFIPIFDSRSDVDFPFKVIGEVTAAPMGAERDFGHDPIELLKEQAREMGGTALLEARSGDDRDSKHVWKAKVIVPK